jgi:hypothetical protein
MVENAQQLERDDPNNPWVPVAKEFACAAFVEQASSGNPNNESLVRLARAVETIKQYKAFDQ